MTGPLTATVEEDLTLFLTEQRLIHLWSFWLARDHRPEFIVALIVAAVDFEPRLGLTMDACTRWDCPMLVDDRARDEYGLFCSQECSDAHSERLDEARHRALLADGRFDVKTTTTHRGEL
jgi:hypothetical protein